MSLTLFSPGDKVISTDRIVTSTWSNNQNNFQAQFTSSTQANFSSPTSSGQFFVELFNQPTDNLTGSVEVQCSIAYGHRMGSGSPAFTDSSGSLGIGASKVIYGQYQQLVYNDETTFFSFNNHTPDHIYVVNVNRARYKHNGKPHDRVITLPANVTKSREEEYTIITDGIQWVLDSLSYQRAKPKYQKYTHIKWLFPRSRIASDKLGDVHFCRSDAARTKNLESVWKKIKAKTGIDGQKKLFRKSLSTIATDTLGSAEKAISLTGHKQTATLQKHYYKTDIDEQIKYADDVAKVYAFKKK